MPTVLISCGPRATRRLEQGLRRLGHAVPAAAEGDDGPHRARILRGEELAVYVGAPARAAHDDDSGISAGSGVVLALEGYVTHRPERGASLRSVLIEDFLEHGETCVARWRGSFRLLISHRGVTRVYTDHTASRPLFVADDGIGLTYSSHTAPLLAAAPRLTLDGANLLHFMHNGRFFAGGSLFAEVRQVGPGRCHRIGSRGTGRDEFAWYRYELRPQVMAARDVLPELKRRLDTAVMRHWCRAESPVLLLSGGYDSRYILNTLAQNVPPGSLGGLFTCLWGEPSTDPGCDAAWAAREARRHAVAFEFFPLGADVPSLFEPMFQAQSGMTEHVMTHTDDLARCRDLSRRGYRSLLRGDECFGPNGAEVNGVPEALARLGLRGLPPRLPWLAADPRAADWRVAHEQRLERLGQVADEPNDVRDLLYFHERLPSVQAHLNAQRAPFVENHNPLLDADVLDLVRRLPRELRTDKRVFRMCFQEYFPTPGFATSGNAFAIERLWREPRLARFIAGKLEQLPAPFAEGYFGPLAMRFRQAAAGEISPPASEQVRLACRAVVLGHTLRLRGADRRGRGGDSGGSA